MYLKYTLSLLYTLSLFERNTLRIFNVQVIALRSVWLPLYLGCLRSKKEKEKALIYNICLNFFKYFNVQPEVKSKIQEIMNSSLRSM